MIESEQMLEAFKAMMRDIKTPVLVNFQRKNDMDDRNTPPFVEVIQPEYNGRLRKFELNYEMSKKIIEHYNLPYSESAVIFENGTTFNHLQGFKNVRAYLRTLTQRN